MKHEADIKYVCVCMVHKRCVRSISSTVSKCLCCTSVYGVQVCMYGVQVYMVYKCVWCPSVHVYKCLWCISVYCVQVCMVHKCVLSTNVDGVQMSMVYTSVWCTSAYDVQVYMMYKRVWCVWCTIANLLNQLVYWYVITIGALHEGGHSAAIGVR